MPFRWVRPEQAGPAAVGLLVPPGTRTVLIVRPRALTGDLLLLQGVAGDRFREMSQVEAQSVVQALALALDRWAQGGRGHVAAVPAARGGVHIWVETEEFSLVLCPRNPGQPYQPLWFASQEPAHAAVSSLQAIFPPGDRVQEVYVNTRNFTTPLSREM